jgi:hypothetical protein
LNHTSWAEAIYVYVYIVEEQGRGGEMRGRGG